MTDAPKLDSGIASWIGLLQRFGRSATGLLILEIGWTSLLVLAAKLADPTGEPRAVGVAFINIWIVGAVIILLIWAIYSRIYAYIVQPVYIIAKPIQTILFIVGVLVGVSLDKVRDRRIEPRRQKMVDQWLDDHRAKRLEKWKAEADPPPTSEELRALDENWLADFNKEHGEGALREVAEDSIDLKKGYCSQLIVNLGKKLLTPLNSGLRIGIAPLNISTFGETLTSLVPPSVQFGDSIAGLLAANSGKTKNINHVHFYTLPTHFAVRTYQQARFTVRFFNLDALIWSPFSDQGRMPSVHILCKVDIGEPTDEREAHLSDHRLFPSWGEMPRVGAFRFAPDDDVDRYIVLLVATLRALSSQDKERSQRATPEGGWARLQEKLELAFSRRLSPRNEGNDLFRHLAWDVLPSIKATPREPGVLSAAGNTAAALVSRWCGSCLAANRLGGEPWKHVDRKRIASQLHAIVTMCTMVNPRQPEDYYRLGAISCWMGAKEQALREFRRAGRLARMSDYSRYIAPWIHAEMDFGSWARGSSYEDKGLLLARFAADAAASIHAGEAGSIRDLLNGEDDRVRKGINFIINREKPLHERPLSLVIVEELLQTSETESGL